MQPGGRVDVYFTCRGSRLLSPCIDQLKPNICWAIALIRHLESLMRRAGLLLPSELLSVAELISITPTSAISQDDGSIIDIEAACEALCEFGTVFEEFAPLHFDAAGELVLLPPESRLNNPAIPRSQPASFDIYYLEIFLMDDPVNGAHMFEQTMLNEFRDNGSLAAWVTMCPVYDSLTGKVYLPTEAAVLKNLDRKHLARGHVMVLKGYGIDEYGQPYSEFQDSYGVKWADNGFTRVARGRNLVLCYVVFSL